MKIKYVLVGAICLLMAVSCFKSEPKGHVRFTLKIRTDDALESFLNESLLRLMTLLKKENIVTVSVKRGQLVQLLMEGYNPGDESRVRELTAQNFNDWELTWTDGRASLRLKTKVMRLIRNEALDQTLEVLKNRLDELGIPDPLLERELGNRIIVEVPGSVDDSDRILPFLKTRALLEWKLVQAGPALDEASLLGKFGGQVPEDMEVVRTNPNVPPGMIFLIDRLAFVSGKDIKSVYPAWDEYNNPAIGFELNSGGSRRFSQLTGDNIGRRLAIVLDGRALAAPVIQIRVENRGIIMGRFTSDEVKDFVLMLKSGALPAGVEVVEMKNL